MTFFFLFCFQLICLFLAAKPQLAGLIPQAQRPYFISEMQKFLCATVMGHINEPFVVEIYSHISHDVDFTLTL